jgi:DNA-binding MarR family transcriptional regulator
LIHKQLKKATAVKPKRAGQVRRLDPTVPNEVDLRILGSIRKIIRSVDLYSRELKSTSEITAPQLICLLTIAKNKSMTATTISREVFLSPSTIVGILDRLEVKGLIKRERSQVDRRVVTVEVTELGRKIVKRSPSPLQERLQRRLSELPSAEQEEIASSLERVVSFMEASDVDAAPILEIGSIASKPADKDGVSQ